MNINVATDGLATTTAAPFEVERLGARLGAEIHGLDLKNGMDAATHKALRGGAGRAQGDRDARPAPRHPAARRDEPAGSASSKCIRCGPQGEFPEILVLDNHKDNPVLSTDVWH